MQLYQSETPSEGSEPDWPTAPEGPSPAPFPVLLRVPYFVADGQTVSPPPVRAPKTRAAFQAPIESPEPVESPKPVEPPPLPPVNYKTTDSQDAPADTPNVFAFDLDDPEPTPELARPKRRTKLMVALLVLVMVGLSAHWHYGPSGPDLDPSTMEPLEDPSEMTFAAPLPDGPAPLPVPPPVACCPEPPTPAVNMTPTMPPETARPAASITAAPTALPEPNMLPTVVPQTSVSAKPDEPVSSFRRQHFKPLAQVQYQTIQPASVTEVVPVPAPQPPVENRGALPRETLPQPAEPAPLPPIEAELGIDITTTDEGGKP